MLNEQRPIAWSLLCVGIVILSVVVYLGCLTGTFIWDDHAIMNGKAIGGGDSLVRCFTKPFLSNYFRPLVSVSFFLERPLSGKTPLFYHQTNILIHALTTAVVIALLLEAFRRRRIALLGGLLFAVQPVQTSAVAWIGGRTDSLCALFMALFAWWLIRAARQEGRTRTTYAVLSSLAFGAALLTKEQMLPAVLLAPLAFRCWSPESGPNSRRVVWWGTVPFLIVTLGYITLYAAFGPSLPPSSGDSLAYIVAEVLRTITYYTVVLLTPTPAAMHTMSLGAYVRAGVWPLIAGVLLTLVGLLLFRRWMRTQPAAAWFLAFIVLTILMVLNIMPVPSMLATPYRAAVSGMGAVALIAWGLVGAASWTAEVLRQHHFGSALRIAVPYVQGVLISIIVLWWGGLTAWGAARWQDAETIAGTIVHYDPDSLWARYNLTSALLNAKKQAAAVVQMEELMNRLFGSSAWRQKETALQAIRKDRMLLARIHEIQGTHIGPRGWLANLYARLGFAYMDQQRMSEACKLFQIGVAIYPKSPDANEGLGECAYFSKDYPAAVRALSMAVAINPELTTARNRLAQTYAAMGEWRKARDQYRLVLKSMYWTGQVYIELAQVEMKLGDYAAAARTLEQALRRAPYRPDIEEMLTKIYRDHLRRSEFPAKIHIDTSQKL